VSHLTRDKVVDEWLAEAELAVRAAQEVVEAAERELRAAQGRLVRLRAAREVAAEADAVVREHTGEAPAGTVPSVRAEQALVPKWRSEMGADLVRVPRWGDSQGFGRCRCGAVFTIGEVSRPWVRALGEVPPCSWTA
jgi:hypothetical protein